jgi:putative hydrolase of the HAD superfamily
MQTIKAILFDAGDPLNCPTSGNWFVPIGYEQQFAREFGDFRTPQVQQAFRKASDFLDTNHRLDTEEQEYEQFVEFYRILLTEYGYPKMTDDLLADMAWHMVYNDKKFTFFDDVFTIIPHLYKHFTLGIISNTWPSLDRVFRHRNLRQYFPVFVMSSDFGVWKPHPMLYARALEELQLPPEATLFVDDRVENLEGAARQGMHGVLIHRYDQCVPQTKFPVITTLTELDSIVAEFS